MTNRYFMALGMFLSVACAGCGGSEGARHQVQGSPVADPWAGKDVTVQFDFEGLVTYVASGQKNAETEKLYVLLPDGAGEADRTPSELANIDAADLKTFHCGRQSPMESHFAQVGIPHANVAGIDAGRPGELLIQLSRPDPFDRMSLGKPATFELRLEPDGSGAPVVLGSSFQQIPELKQHDGSSLESTEVLAGATAPGTSLPQLAARFIFSDGERFEAGKVLTFDAASPPYPVPLAWQYRKTASVIANVDGNQVPVSLSGRLTATRVGSPTLVVRRTEDGKEWSIALRPDGNGRVSISVRNQRASELLLHQEMLITLQEPPDGLDGCIRLEHSKLFLMLTKPRLNANGKRAGPFLFPRLVFKQGESPAGYCIGNMRMRNAGAS